MVLIIAVTVIISTLFTELFLSIVKTNANLGGMPAPETTYIERTYKDIQIIDVSPKSEEVEATPTTEAETTESTEPTPEPTPEPAFTSYEVELIGRTIWGEAGGVKSEAERAAVAWCILNRVDAWDKSIYEVVTAPSQFHGYRAGGTCPQEHLDLAADVLARWEAERAGKTEVGRTLPANYLYFWGDGLRNHFRTEWQSSQYWDWSLTDPYTL